MNPGSKLGPYEIIEQLGAGGMGEVYLGEDTRLGRKVAIKVLPAEFASDPERLARFEQEARAAAALNHPHIAVVHDIGTEGDIHFMVQEYLEGQSLRERLDADLFAFGCVLYEVPAGKRAFGRETVLDTLHAIARSEPQPLGEIKPDLPAELQRIVRKCLAKLPARRYQHADDVAVDLRQLQDDITAGVAFPVSEGQAVAAPGAVETARGISWKLAASLALAIALLAAFGVWSTTLSPPELPESLITRFYIDYPGETASRGFFATAVAISPDGTSVVFDADRQLWLRAIDDLVATPIRGTEGARMPFFSPDGQQLGFWGRGDGQMKSVSITGGAPVSLGPAPQRVYGASWANDGYVYFGQGAAGILRVSDNGGDPETVVEMAEGEQAHGPQLLPGGEWLLYTLLSGSGSWNNASIVAQPVSGGERKVLVDRGTDGRYVPTGHIVYFLGDNLFAVPFDADSLEVAGGSVSIVEGVRQAFGGFTGASQYAFSDRGGLVYMGASDDAQLVWLDRSGQVELLPFEPRSSLDLDLSPDDRRIALEIEGDDEEYDIWIYEVERGGSSVLLTTDGDNRMPVWSPDGDWVFFASDRSGNSDIWKRRADRSLAAEPVLNMEAAVWPKSISDDGGMLLFESRLGLNADVGILALDAHEPEMLVATAAAEFGPTFSPDGRFFAFNSNETGQFEVWVMEVASGRRFGPVSTSTRGGVDPRWSRNGREIYYRSVTSPGILVVEVEMEPFSASDPLELVDIVMPSLSRFDVTEDGQKFLVAVPAGSGETGDTASGARLNVVLNWFEELKQRVPTGR